MIGIFSEVKLNLRQNIRPNQGIWNSLKHGFFVCFVIIFFLTVFRSFFSFDLFYNIYSKDFGDNISATILITCFTLSGGFACMQHFILRLVLYSFDQIPWNFVTFFKQAEARLFIQRSGGSYSFIHRYLQEHFASLHPNDSLIGNAIDTN